MPSIEETLEEVTETQNAEIEAVLDPVESDAVFRDSRQCAALALQASTGQTLLSPPTPRPKKA
ncbi:hypothetical protein GCM10010129_05030 [Streptomyces fumigatiscleroticus]|nr:hypothetical protein GCM10010129_05030 [Streptomyces fumigatiscleroticus]